MNFNRRSFFKVCLGAVAAGVVPLLPAIPKIAVFEKSVGNNPEIWNEKPMKKWYRRAMYGSS